MVGGVGVCVDFFGLRDVSFQRGAESGLCVEFVFADGGGCGW